MKPLSAIALIMFASAASGAEGLPPAQRDMVLWYRQPARQWQEAMLMGNGLVGATVFGGTSHERISLNESSFWSGLPHNYDNPEALEYFPKIRELVFAQKFQEAEKMADEHFFGHPQAQQAYQPLGDLLLDFEGEDQASDYRRELDMETGIARITYRAGDATITREIFVSYPDRVMVMRISSDKPGRISLAAQFKSPYLDAVKVTGNTLLADGQWKGPLPGNNALIAHVEGSGLKFEAAMRAVAEGGQVEAGDGILRVKGATGLTLVLAAATSYVNYHDITGDPAEICRKTLAACGGKDFAVLRTRHEGDFRGMMGRVHLKVGDPAKNEAPTDERLRAAHAGQSDANLEALCFQFGRYALVSSSRAGGQPANLQGIWNESVSPSWGSKYTININTEMDYWPTEICNLSECHEPVFDMLQDVSETGANTAKVQYNCGGWVCHHNIDLWRGTAPVDAARYGMWPVGGAWLCQDVWEHYAFTGDRAFLEKYYPVMKGAAQFLLEVMADEPRHHWLVTPFSMSPEHGYYDAGHKLCFLSPAPTMDVGIMRELFPHCIEASRLLGTDDEFRAKLEAALKKLPPYQIDRHGHLQEWIDDWEPGGQGHNCSPNFPFYPGNSITLRGDPALAGAVAKWMETRRPGGGFPSVWYISVWSRLERSDKVAAFVTAFVSNNPGPNMHNKGANQSDATFGYTAGVAESLVQSHDHEISLLPAVSTAWNSGSVSGLRARGGFEVSIAWTDGKLTSAEIRSDKSQSYGVRYGAKSVMVPVSADKPARLNANLSVMK
jgi:alpha-L-fucosidase 2